MDAMIAQKDHARYLVEDRHAHHLLSVRNNQPTFSGQLRKLPWDKAPVLDRSRERGHGREEVWEVKVVSVDGLLGTGTTSASTSRRPFLYLLDQPAVSVRVAEGGERTITASPRSRAGDAPLVSGPVEHPTLVVEDFSHVHVPLDEFGMGGLDVRDNEMSPWTDPGSAAEIPFSMLIEHLEPGGVNWTTLNPLSPTWSMSIRKPRASWKCFARSTSDTGSTRTSSFMSVVFRVSGRYAAPAYRARAPTDEQPDGFAASEIRPQGSVPQRCPRSGPRFRAPGKSRCVRLYVNAENLL